jgi:DNA-directed RNA polymerase subunit M/transcription elongation factor TFIIS
MRFCDVCENMMFVRYEGSAQPHLQCRNCDSVAPLEDACVFMNDYADDHDAFRRYVSRHIRHDVTLPRVDNIPCPSCAKKGGAGGAAAAAGGPVVFIKYDANLKYLYFCETCEAFWKAGDGEEIVDAKAPRAPSSPKAPRPPTPENDGVHEDTV